MRPIFAAATATALAALTALPALSQPVELLPVTYLCERGVAVQVVYVNGPDGDSHAIALIEGRMHVLPIAIAASGARYRENGEGYEIWNKGNAATISYGPDGAATTLLTQCAAQPAP